MPYATATMASPNAKAMPNTLIAVAPAPIPPIVAAPHPNKTNMNVPMNSASGFLMEASDEDGLKYSSPTSRTH
jgi:hypothetical protein